MPKNPKVPKVPKTPKSAKNAKSAKSAKNVFLWGVSNYTERVGFRRKCVFFDPVRGSPFDGGLFLRGPFSEIDLAVFAHVENPQNCHFGVFEVFAF